MGSQAQIKGGILKSRLEFVRQKRANALEEVLARLPDADQKTLRGMLLAVSWYPFELCKRLDHAIAEVLSPGDFRRVFIDMGRASADTNLTGVHKAFVRVGDPQYILSYAPQIYSQYYDKGNRTYEQTSETSGVIKTFGAQDVTVNDCLTVVGWHHRAIEICGGREVIVNETMCCAAQGTHCEYVCEWKM